MLKKTQNNEVQSESYSGWWKLGAGIVVLGAEGIAGYLHPMLVEILAIADVIIPLIIALVLLTAILRGSKDTCERVFRLLRWIANRPEPPAPSATPRH
jgi:hypothetical protein